MGLKLISFKKEYRVRWNNKFMFRMRKEISTIDWIHGDLESFLLRVLGNLAEMFT